MWPQKTKSKQLRSGERGSQATGPPTGIRSKEVIMHLNPKMCWYTLAHEPHVLVPSEQSSLQILRVDVQYNKRHLVPFRCSGSICIPPR
ncbi:hypothetical protein TNCV_2920651 [Trichonephila clavipes]|nr:hypothetical protein TNCV_2920651 [Trichonephila clavipes]